MTDDEHGRRCFLCCMGATLAIGGLAGCTGGSGNESATETSEETTGFAVDAATETGSTETATAPFLEPAPQTVNQFLSQANNYDGNMVIDESRVAVGAGEEQLGFDPAAIEITTGTEVRWEVAGGNQPHNVVSIAQTGSDERTLDSGEPQQGNEVIYRYTFEQPGIYRYVCSEHRDQGALGAVVVREGSVTTTNESG